MRLSEWPLIVMNYFSHVWNSLQECLLLLNTGTTHLTRQDMWREVNRRHGQHPILTLFVQRSHIFTPHQQWEGSEVFNLEGGVGKAEALCHGDVEEWHHCQTKGILTFSVLLPWPGSLKSLYDDRFFQNLKAIEIEPLEESAIYLQDWLGLRHLHDRGALHRLEMEGDHMDFQPGWFSQNVIENLLKKTTTD